MTPPLCMPMKQIKHPFCFADSTSSKSQLHINHILDTFLWWIFRLNHKLHNHLKQSQLVSHNKEIFHKIDREINQITITYREVILYSLMRAEQWEELRGPRAKMGNDPETFVTVTPIKSRRALNSHVTHHTNQLMCLWTTFVLL